MPRVDVVRTSPIVETFRVAKVQGQFDLPRRGESQFELHTDVPIDERDWTVGLITGASGTGKSTVADTLWPGSVIRQGEQQWEAASLVDDFPDGMTPTEIGALLTAVGFSSIPAWLRPYVALSTGQQFRADLARALSAPTGELPVVFDEFTSTVDRVVAKAASTAVGKYVRRQSQRFVAVTCHSDVADWLQPDWILNTDTGEFTWRSVQPRPDVPVRIVESHDLGTRYWPMFREHHYMSGDLARAARKFLAYVTLDGEERLAGFASVLPVMGHKGWRRGHRHVVLPDFQGIGLGNRMIETVAQTLWERERLRYREVTSAPGFVAHRRRHPEMWRLASGPGMNSAASKKSTRKSKSAVAPKTSVGRLSTAWVHLPAEL